MSTEVTRPLQITGEGLRHLTPEKLEMLSTMLGGLGLELTRMTEEEPSDGSATQTVPVMPDILLTKRDLRGLAENYGFSPIIGARAWSAVGLRAHSTRFANLTNERQFLNDSKYPKEGISLYWLKQLAPDMYDGDIHQIGGQALRLLKLIAEYEEIPSLATDDIATP